MTSRLPWRASCATIAAFFAFIALCPYLAGSASAACAAPAARALRAEPPSLGPASARPRWAAAGDDSRPARGSIVGMWQTVFALGDGTKYDESFQQFHNDGTEMMLSNGLPPVLGNVCLGVWEKHGSTIRLRHTAWNWDANGQLAGTFVMIVTLKLDRRGNGFSGTWAAENFDVDNTVIPELRAEGTVVSTRITVD
jgi:hypothetical protein